MSLNVVIKQNSEEDVKFYKTYYNSMLDTMTDVINRIRVIDKEMEESYIESVQARIKTKDSMINKLIRRDLDPTEFNAVNSLFDSIGVRIICNFVNDIYLIRDELVCLKDYEIIDEKDYISHPKKSGYRSYHIILKTKDNMFVEIQIRTIAMDCWATLEHKLAYKKDLNNHSFIRKQLKICSDQIAATDLALENIRDLINS